MRVGGNNAESGGGVSGWSGVARVVDGVALGVVMAAHNTTMTRMNVQ